MEIVFNLFNDFLILDSWFLPLEPVSSNFVFFFFLVFLTPRFWGLLLVYLLGSEFDRQSRSLLIAGFICGCLCLGRSDRKLVGPIASRWQCLPKPPKIMCWKTLYLCILCLRKLYHIIILVRNIISQARGVVDLLESAHWYHSSPYARKSQIFFRLRNWVINGVNLIFYECSGTTKLISTDPFKISGLWSFMLA